MKKKGFTLIELIVVISVTAVLSVVGIAAFVTYSRTQALTTSAQDVASILNVAKSRAQSQVKPASGPCASGVLDGYKVVVTSSTAYELNAVCGGNDYQIAEQTKTLGKNVIFSSPIATAFFFRVLTGGVEGAQEVVISGYGKTKAVTVTQSGIIQVVNR